jgi:hypothetical protein
MRNRFVSLAGVLAMSAVSATSQAWMNPGTSTSPSSCAPFHDQYGDGTSYYCYYQGSFPWFDAGGGWTTMLRVAAPASGTIQVTYNFFEQTSDGTIQPASLDYTQYGQTTPGTDSQVVFVLSPNQPSELTLLGRHVEGGSLVEAKGSVKLVIACADKATCAAVTPQLIYTYLPKNPWYLSGAMTSDISLPSQPDSLVWSAVGINDPTPSDASKVQFMTFAILNESGSDQTYTVTAYDKTGALVGSKTTESVVAGQSVAQVLQAWMTGLPSGLLKVRVSSSGSSIVTFLQFNGLAATALLPVAEQFPVAF